MVEAAVVGFPHDVKGEGIYAFVILKGSASRDATDEELAAISVAVRSSIGPFVSVQIMHGNV